MSLSQIRGIGAAGLRAGQRGKPVSLSQRFPPDGPAPQQQKQNHRSAEYFSTGSFSGPGTSAGRRNAVPAAAGAVADPGNGGFF